MSPRRVTLVADELLGYAGSGGLGTATTHLALGLARLGHRVEIRYFGASTADREWARRYEDAGVRVYMLERSDDRVEPSYFAWPREIAFALRDDPPDVVVVQDLGAPGYVALRLRQLGLAFGETLFVVYCHGTRRWITDASRKVRVLPGAHAITVLEQMSIELADVAVSPSAYMIDWMQRQGWRLPPEAIVIPLLTSAAATGQPPSRVETSAGRIERIAFFGRLDPRKGVKLFVAAVNALGPEILQDMELVFIGRPSPIVREEIEAAISVEVRRALRTISFESALAQNQALELVSRPGTLAMMPSLEDNSPNTVYECLERGIPFMASDAGGTSELIAPADRAYVLFEPTVEGVEAALRRALSDGVPPPARPAFDAGVSLQRWADVVARRPRVRSHRGEQARVDVVVVHKGSNEALERCLAALATQTYANFGLTLSGPAVPELRDPTGRAVIVASEGTSIESSRAVGLRAGTAPWVVFLEEEDVPERDFVETLVTAQAASQADLVTCGLYLRGDDGRLEERFFLGATSGLAALYNGYGSIALLRRSLLTDDPTPWPAVDDPDWPLLTRMSLPGARIVSVPVPLVTRTARPGALERNPSDALLVLEHLERALPDHLRGTARLAAGLAAQGEAQAQERSTRRVVRRAHELLRNDGPTELARRALLRVTRVAS